MSESNGPGLISISDIISKMQRTMKKLRHLRYKKDQYRESIDKYYTVARSVKKGKLLSITDIGKRNLQKTPRSW
jgi:flagellar motor component MotA